MLHADKIIFTGPMGAGKTTAISSISDEPPVSTDVAITDGESAHKASTTVGMDYGFIRLDETQCIHLYGTPGQKRFEFMWDILVKGGIGLVLLIDNSKPDPLSDMEFYLNAFDAFIKETGVVIGVTRSDVNRQVTIEDYHNKLIERGQVAPIFEIDGRSREDIAVLLQALLACLQVESCA